MRIQRAQEHKKMPWKNGKGVTLEIQTGGANETNAGDWAWRVSAAAVVENGPFSIFQGMDRFLTIYKGAEMRLTHSNQDVERVMKPFEVARFSGDVDTHAAIPAGPVRDLGLIVVRGRVKGDLVVADRDSVLMEGFQVLVALEKAEVIVDGQQVQLDVLDSILDVGKETVCIQSGTIALVYISTE
ncbi:hypothetical protein HDU77_010380 [Chytriomyces hyalinus]|nr:hypothetical protein HDU77_010380 [Chytriomyces hyalinus]